MGKRKTKNEDKPPLFEEAIGRLEAIVETMEAGGLGLDELVQKYEEGAGLLKLCQERLEDAQRRVELIDGGGGSRRLVPYGETDDGGDDEKRPDSGFEVAPETNPEPEETDEEIGLF
jgi:exodeoxyribonuclease VII small subunit